MQRSLKKKSKNVKSEVKAKPLDFTKGVNFPRKFSFAFRSEKGLFFFLNGDFYFKRPQ